MGTPPPNDQIETAHPLAPPPEVIDRADRAVIGLIGDALGLSDHDLFLSDEYWPWNFSNNSTVMA